MNPTLGDVVRTHLKLKNKTPEDLWETYQVEHRVWDKACKHFRKTMGDGWKTLPREESQLLATYIGEKQSYWNRVNKILYNARSRHYYPIEKQYVVNLGDVEKMVSSRETIFPEVEVDTDVSSQTVLGLFLVYGSSLLQKEITIDDNKYNIRFFTAYGNSIDENYNRIIWIVMRKLSEQLSNSTTAITIPDLLQAGVDFPTYYSGEGERCLRGLVCFVTMGKQISKIRPFNVLIRETKAVNYVVEWNKDFLHMISQKHNGVSGDDVWKKYL